MEIKEKYTLEDEENEEKYVNLFFHNGEVYSGIFAGMDGDDTIMLDAEKGKGRIGLPMSALKNYAIEIK